MYASYQFGCDVSVWVLFPRNQQGDMALSGPLPSRSNPTVAFDAVFPQTGHSHLEKLIIFLYFIYTIFPIECIKCTYCICSFKYVKVKLVECLIHCRRNYIVMMKVYICATLKYVNLLKIIPKIFDIFGRSWGNTTCWM